MEIEVKKFYRDACPTKAVFDELVKDVNKALALRRVVRAVTKDLEKGKYTEGKLLGLLSEGYKDSFFAFPWQKEQTIKDDAKKIIRFVGNFSNDRIIEAGRRVAVDTGKNVVSATADLIWQNIETKSYGACVILSGKANKSPGGKSVHTKTETDLYLMTLKAGLERTYPEIAVSLIYLTNDADSFGKIGSFVVSKTKQSNIFTETYDKYYEDGEFAREAFLQKIDEVVSQPPKPDCYSCYEKDLCSNDSIFTMDRTKARVVEGEADKEYKMPSFTDTQKQVIAHKEGPMLVCAGPGSGKTATLIGRGKALMDSGVEPEFILAITFTNKAANELKSRFKACCGDDVPKCSTIHALALEILQNNKTLCGETKVFPQYDKVRLCEDLSDTLGKPIDGFKYGTGKEGKNAFLLSLSKRIDEYLVSPEAFKKKYPDIGADFYTVVGDYERIVKARGYAGFDDIIKKCNVLFAEHPEIAKTYSNIFKYIMVDEYQDIDTEQAKFIYALASHKNLVVVGDDDQTIYEFRGGTNKYMLEFKDRFKNAKVVVLDRNFRSTGELVRASQNFIKGNKERIDKNIGSARQAGQAPKVISGQSPKDVTGIVEEAIKAGYKYSDIAVLAWKNPTLEEMSKVVSFPSVLGKAMLTDNALFRVALDILYMSFKGMDDRHMAHYLTVMGMDDLSGVVCSKDGLMQGLRDAGFFDNEGRPNKKKADEGPAEALIYDALKLFSDFDGIIKKGCAAFFFLDAVLDRFDMEDTSVAEALEGVLETRQIKTVDKLFEVFQYMEDFGDETRLEPERGDSVLFITSHESKGMEFPIVIMIDDYSDDGKEGTKRLYYVAMTRAKDRLYILKKKGSETLFDLVKAG